MPYSAARFSAVTPIGQPAWLSVVRVRVRVRDIGQPAWLYSG